MENFDLYIKAYEPMTLEEYEAEEFQYDDYLYPKYEEADEDEKADILEESYNHAMELWEEDFYHEIHYDFDGFNKVMENFNNDLIFHKVELKGGYYTGVQLYVEEKENPYELDNEDCKYYYDMYRSQAIRKYDAEIHKINKWMEKVATKYGWRKLNCLGIFSNGEAIYEYAK